MGRLQASGVLPVVAFGLILGLWTWQLLVPHPVPPAVRDEFSPDLLFLASKLAHAGAYAFLTVLAAALPVSRRQQRLVVAGLLLHAVGTEIGQTFVPNRTGRVWDVLIDWGGVALGRGVLALSRRPSAAPPTPPA